MLVFADGLRQAVVDMPAHAANDNIGDRRRRRPAPITLRKTTADEW
jgi:hypothetical protein